MTHTHTQYLLLVLGTLGLSLFILQLAPNVEFRYENSKFFISVTMYNKRRVMWVEIVLFWSKHALFHACSYLIMWLGTKAAGSVDAFKLNTIDTRLLLKVLLKRFVTGELLTL